MTALGGRGAGDDAAGGDDGAVDGWSEFPASARLVSTGPGCLLLVADGMGGAAAGEIASRLAVTTVQEIVASRWAEASSGGKPPRMPEALSGLLQEAVLEANRRIHDWGGRHPEYRGMGSTLTAVGVVDRTAVVAHVGDSRAYLVRDGRPAQLTDDQTMARKLVEAGRLAPEEAKESSQAHMLLQALGTEPKVQPEVDAHPLQPDDLLLLCSDGLSETVSAGGMAEVLAGAPDLGRAADELIDRANEGGGPDNITVLLARVEFPVEPGGRPA